MSAAADMSNDEIVQQALKIWKKTENTDKYRKYLENHGFRTSNKQKSVEIPERDSDEVSTHSFEQWSFNFDFTLGKNSYDPVVYPFVTFHIDKGWLRSGEKPDDGVAFGWDSDEYDYANQWSGSKHADEAEYTGQGISFEYDDRFADMKTKGENWVQAKAQIEGGTPSTRNIIFSYWHAYSAQEASVGIDTDGVVTVNTNSVDEKWSNPVQDQIFEE